VRALPLLLLAACSDDPSPPEDPGGVCTAQPTRTGEGTYYGANGQGACGFAADDSEPLLVAAMNLPDWNGSRVCGMCAEVTGPLGTVTVRVVDQCPECDSGDLDLSPEAFDLIAERAAGRVPISWTEVPCPTRGPLVFHFKDGSHQWWTAIQIREHRHRIASLAYRDAAGTWRDLERLGYNYFVVENLGVGPFALKVTDVFGHEVVDEDVPLLDDADHASDAQLSACP
jgi:expansin